MNSRGYGFTLLEVVVAIVLSAVALAVVVPLLGRVFLHSHEPRSLLREAFDLHAAMESLVAWKHNRTLDQMQAIAGAEGSQYEGLMVVHNRYIAFTGYTEGGAPVTNNLLKITLRNNLGEALTRLFSEVPP